MSARRRLRPAGTPHPMYAEIGARIRAARVERGMTVEALASVIGTSRGYFTMWESGKRQIYAHHLAAIARALSVPVAALYPDQPDDEPIDYTLTATASDLHAMGRIIGSRRSTIHKGGSMSTEDLTPDEINESARRHRLSTGYLWAGQGMPGQAVIVSADAETDTIGFSLVRIDQAMTDVAREETGADGASAVVLDISLMILNVDEALKIQEAIGAHVDGADPRALPADVPPRGRRVTARRTATPSLPPARRIIRDESWTLEDGRTLKLAVSILDGYRSVEDQIAVGGAAADCGKWVACVRDGVCGSMHCKGLAADLTFDSDATKARVHDNADRYGLTFRMYWEDWHIEPKGAFEAQGASS